MARFRAIRVLVSAALTVVAGTLGHVVVLVGRARYLEDLCVTREPAEAWAPPDLMNVVRGPVPHGLVDFRCEAQGAPQYHFSFTDPIPLLGTCAVAAAVVLLLWVWALRAQSTRGAGHGDLHRSPM